MFIAIVSLMREKEHDTWRLAMCGVNPNRIYINGVQDDGHKSFIFSDPLYDGPSESRGADERVLGPDVGFINDGLSHDSGERTATANQGYSKPSKTPIQEDQAN